MKTKEFQLLKCLNPQSIVNRYTNERLLVECGKCKACRCRKGSISALKCKLESLSHKYTMFVTLTYSNDYVPLMDYFQPHLENYTYNGVTTSFIPREQQAGFYELTPRLGVGTILTYCDYGENTLTRLRNKTNVDGKLPHLSKRDAQLFMKRLRKRISNYETEKIRYFLVGEYGPVHFRPHYHLQLWFSSDKIYENIRQDISASWRYGRIDVETSLGKSADYVAKYVNSHCGLPRIYQQKETKPFAIHSNHLGEMVLKQDKEKIFSSSPRDFVFRSIPLGSNVAEFGVWRSFKTFYFPRCKNYALLSESQRLYAYRLVYEARAIYGVRSLVEYANLIISKQLDINNPNFNWLLDVKETRLLKYFADEINPYDLSVPESYEKYFRKVYMELRLSKHFVDFICDSNPDKFLYYFTKIQAFWKEVDYLNLIQQYEDMTVFAEQWFTDEEDFQMFYANYPHDLDNYKNSKYYNAFVYQTNVNYEMSVKHKKLNDMNKIFENK